MSNDISSIVDALKARSEADEAARDRHLRLARQHQSKADAIKRIGHMDVVRAIAAEVVARMPGLTAEFYGPFGLGSEFSFHLNDESGKTVASAGFRPGPDFAPVMIGTLADHRYPPNSVGSRSGLNRASAPMPNTIDELVEMLRSQMAERNAAAAA